MKLVDRARVEAYLAQRPVEAVAAIGPRPPGAAAPLSFAQQQIWLHAQLASGLPLYNEALTIRRRGGLDVEVLEMALTEIVRRHEAWRTTFGVEDGQPVQVVQPPFAVRVPVIDLTAMAAAAREREAVRLATEDARRPFSLTGGPLLRALVVRLAPDDHRLFLTVHHIAIDGVSIYRVLLPELAALYEAFVTGRPSPLPEPTVQYADFALWQRGRLESQAPAESLAYWRQRLRGIPELALPLDHRRPAVQRFAGARHRLALSPALTTSVRALARRERTSVFMILLGAFEALLHRLTGQDDLVLGTVSAGRARPETERLLGFFANPIPLRADLGGDPTVGELLGRVRDATLEDLAHDDVPFELLVRELGVEHDASRNPLFQVTFSLEAPRAPLPGGWDAGHLDVDTGTSKFDLYLELDELPDAIVGRIVYRTDLFEAATIERLARRYERVLEATVADPGLRLSAMPLLDDAERRQLLAWGTPRAPYPETCTVHGLFEAQAAQTPDAVALVSDDARLTYHELDVRAERLARHLRALGVGPDTLVGVLLDRSPELVVAYLAILKAGGGYVPLDPGYPLERLRFMVADAGVGVVVARTSAPDPLGDSAVDVVGLDGIADGPGEDCRHHRGPGGGPDHVAYVMFTSGSTGRPKGVAVPHRAIVRLLFGQTYAHLDATRIVLFTSAVSFDVSTFELWGALLHGGRCVLMPAGVPTPTGLAEAIRRHDVTTVWLTASLFNAVIDEAPQALAGASEVLVGGEALSVTHVRRAQESLPGVTIVNGYGPTECTAFACCYRVPPALEPVAPSVPIGPPIRNTEAYVLDRRRDLVPLGAVGELYLGGPGLARGYLNRPELTAERFVPHPFDPSPGARLYRTGDLARWRPDGALDFFGRLDTQVKIRGVRIEPGEIEKVMETHAAVGEAVVLPRERAAGDRELIAYVVPRGAAPDAETLREFLRARLPATMIPAGFVTIPAVPLTPVGKVDRRALAAMSPPAMRSRRRLAPRDPLEALLVALWEDVLGVSGIGVRDDFFALGGHSLTAVRMAQRVERHLGQTLPLGELHTHPTVEDLARALLRRDRERCLAPVLRLQAQGRRRPLFFFHGDLNGGGFYCRDLARHLGRDQPVYAVHPLGLDRRPVPATIEAMAVEHLRQIRGLQPHGPYFIGGYCNGGLTAYEVARALAADGEVVEPLVLIAAAADTRLRAVRWLLDRVARRLRLGEDEAADYFGRLRYLADRWAGLGTRGRLALALETAATLAAEAVAGVKGARPAPFARTRIAPDAGTAVRVADRLLSEDTFARYFTAVMAYVPRRFAGRLLVFWPAAEVPRRPDDPTLGWGPLVERVDVITVPGDHHTIVTRHSELIARAVQGWWRDGENGSAMPARAS